jgi:hypothetical protein
MPFYEAFYVFFALVIENDSFSWTLNEHIEHGDMQTDIIFKFLNILKFIFWIWRAYAPSIKSAFLKTNFCPTKITQHNMHLQEDSCENGGGDLIDVAADLETFQA